MIGERAGLIAVVQKDQPPAVGGRHLAPWDEREGRGIDAPDRPEVPIRLLIENRVRTRLAAGGNRIRTIGPAEGARRRRGVGLVITGGKRWRR
jgi:hypothetical protein